MIHKPRVRLPDDQLADYGPWFDNHRRLRELITELEAPEDDASVHARSPGAG